MEDATSRISQRWGMKNASCWSHTKNKTGEEESPPGRSWGEERNLCWCCWLWWGQQLCRTGWQGYGNVGKYNSDSQQLILCVSVGVVTFVCCTATFSKIDWNYLKHENTFFCRVNWIRSFYIMLYSYVEDAMVLVFGKTNKNCGCIRRVSKTAVSWYYSKQ